MTTETCWSALVVRAGEAQQHTRTSVPTAAADRAHRNLQIIARAQECMSNNAVAARDAVAKMW